MAPLSPRLPAALGGGATGAGVVAADLVGSVVFASAAVLATVWPEALAVPVAVLDVALFAAGCVAFVWSFLVVVARSRTEAISVASTYFLTGGTAPSPVRLVLLGALAAQVVVALATASIRPFTALAFGILVPVYGLGLNGLWAARHGSFPGRADA